MTNQRKPMDDRVKRLDTPQKCEIFAKNATERGHPELAQQAIERAVELRAEAHNAQTEAEKEALQAIYAYEELLTDKNGKRTRANRTWQMIDRHGIIEAIERSVNRPVEPQGYTLLKDKGLEEHAFEAVILRHPDVFSDEAKQISAERLKDWTETSES